MHLKWAPRSSTLSNMYFNEFQKQMSKAVTGHEIVSQAFVCGRLVQETVDNMILVDRKESNFLSLEEARDFIKHQKMRDELQLQIQQEQYTTISDSKIADIIKEYHSNVKVTDTLIESYVELASSKLFTTDPVALDIRNLNKFDRLIESHVDFKLNDGTTIVISEDVQLHINNTFAEHLDVIEHMRESKENFLSVLNQLED